MEFLPLLLLILFGRADHAYGDASSCFPALFSFGSSIADTGSQASAMPFPTTSFEPYGCTYFDYPTGRASDGRLHIDFWASALGLPFLDPYLRSVGTNFSIGVNFAAAGATAQIIASYSPFHLSIQLNQFLKFKDDVHKVLSEDCDEYICSVVQREECVYPKLPRVDYFRDGLYVIAIGANDLFYWIKGENKPASEVLPLVPLVSQAILRVVEVLYSEGARNILIEDVYPIGCSPNLLSYYKSQYSDQLDPVGCIKPINNLAELHNSLLKQGVAELGKRLTNASIAVINTFSKRYEVITNYEKYGFKYPLKVCCGMGGDYNYRSDCPCAATLEVDGQSLRAGKCDNVSEYVMWDGIHYTEAFNRLVMKSVLSGELFEPAFDIIRNGCIIAEIS